jgi:hypothetical protein
MEDRAAAGAGRKELDKWQEACTSGSSPAVAGVIHKSETQYI